MINFSNLAKQYDYRTLPRIETAYLKFLWHSDYWDGALSGMLLYNDVKYWFEIFGEADEDEDYYRRFFIIELTPQQLAEEEKWHQLFREKVGTHTDYDEDGRCSLMGTLKPRELWDEFYEPYKHHTPLDFSKNRFIGWFEK